MIEGFRLSPQQKRLWQLQVHANAYFTQCVIHLQGPLQVEQLQAALQTLVDRHEILRTSFHCLPGMTIPVQAIAAQAPVKLEIQDWRDRNADDLDQAMQSQQAAFDLQQAPLMRATLLMLADQDHRLLLSLPALCGDRWTVNNLLQELSQAYTGQSEAEEPVQYLQFSEWQHELLEDEDAEAGAAYWQQAGLNLTSLKLPFERRTVDPTAFKPAVYSLALAPEVAHQLQAIAQQQAVTLEDCLLACWQAFVARISTQNDLTIGVVGSGRKYDELHEVFGLLAKTLPLTTSLNPGLTWRELVTQTSDHLQTVQKWQEYFVAEVKSPESSFPIGFEFETWPTAQTIDSLTVELEQRFVCFEPFKLKLVGVQQANALTLEMHYDTARFGEDAIACWAEQFQTLVAAVVANPDAAIESLNLISDRERQRLLIDFNPTPDQTVSLQCVHQQFEAQAAKTPDAIAVICETEQLTYAELNQRANQLAHHLCSLGVQAESIVAICADRSVAMIVGILSVLKAGAAYLPLDPTLPAERLNWMLQDAQATVLLTQQHLAPQFTAATVHPICLDTDWPAIAQQPDQNLSAKSPESLAYIIYTSGSTGQPKGVAVEHPQLAHYLYSLQERFQLPEAASFALVSTFAADLGHTVVFTSLCTGGCLHILAQSRVADPQALADYCDRHPIDCLKIVPSHLRMLLASAQAAKLLPHRCLILGGEAATWSLVERCHELAPDCQILNHYGPTETTVGALTYAVDPTTAPISETVPIGCPLSHLRVYLLDAQQQPVAIGIPGEVYIAGAGLARGYLNRPELTQERFITSLNFSPRLYRTGDRARYLPNGTLEFLGRVDNQVKIRGFRVELGEIEAALTQHPALREAVVVLREDEPEQPRLVAYIVPRQRGKAPTTSELRSRLSHLPDYMLPAAFVCLDSLPLTPNGKLDRRGLPAPDTVRPDLSDRFVAPRTPLEQQLASIWAEVLQVERVGREDNFFELGGHSLLTTQLLARVQEALNVEVPLRRLLEHPTVAGLAESILAVQTATPGTHFFAPLSINLEAEAVLDPRIDPANASPASSQLHNVLLTGATGFLGAFLLYELLQQTQAQVYCLIRVKSVEEGHQRLRQILESYQIWKESFRDRIVPVVGDLALPQLGLSDEQFHHLAGELDAIYHNGAFVHFTYPYATLKAANVSGTQNILRLASQTKVKPLHYVSTTSVFSGSGYTGIRLVLEQDNPGPTAGLFNGYGQSKWVAEHLVKIAGSRGLPVTIYRPGRITGQSQTGACNPNDFLYRAIAGCIAMGTIPDEDILLNFAPVDYVSRTLVYLSQRPESTGQVFHLVSPQTFHLGQLVGWMAQLGYPLRRVSYDQWRAELVAIGEQQPEHPIYPLVPLLVQKVTSAQTTDDAMLKFECHNTLVGLADSAIACPPTNERLLSVYLSYLERQGLIGSPRIPVA